MASLLNLSETPNLLELVDACRNDVKAGTLGHLSICGDDITLSVCADEPDRLSWAELSLCADDIQSACADESPSDIRLKTNIEQVGTTVYGLPLYHFRYKTGPDRFEGVMAQDVLKVMPDAVVVGEDGYCRVRYAQLGIRMNRA